MKTLQEAYTAGYDKGRNGANEENCSFRFFGTKEMTKEWERGVTDSENKLPYNPTPQIDVMTHKERERFYELLRIYTSEGLTGGLLNFVNELIKSRRKDK